LLKERLNGHKNIGDIRGRGLFWAVRLPFSHPYPHPTASQKSNWKLRMLTLCIARIRQRQNHKRTLPSSRRHRAKGPPNRP
jgi:4-aminobutyrate aminotransferase-like enzyme